MTGGKLAKRRGLYTSEDRQMTGGKLAKLHPRIGR